MPDSINTMLQQCVTDCLDCYRICMETLAYCLERGDFQMEAPLLKLLSACAETCKATAGIMTLNAGFLHFKICEAASELCIRCAVACERFTDETNLQACAHICRRCARSCQQNSTLFYMEEFIPPNCPSKTF